jgi:hypothetical protein
MAASVSAPKQKEQIASPFSTGAGGPVFELKVSTGLLATLLVRGHIPLFENATLHELHLQAEHLDYETDDAVLVTQDSAGRQRRQLWSVKHGVKFTDGDEVFRDVITDAWADFSDHDRFTPEDDALVLATGPLAATYEHLLTALEFARAAASSNDFYARIGRKGFISREAPEYVALIEKRCSDAAGRKLNPDEVWRFLKCFHVLGYDFDRSASQDEACFKSLLSIAIQKATGKTGDDLWNMIFGWVADGNPRAKSFTRDTLPQEWQQITTGIGAYFESGAIQRLLEHSGDLLKRIRTTLGKDQPFHLDRPTLTENLSAVFAAERFTLVTGQAGVGKSAAALVALRQVLSEGPMFVFQAADFAYSNLDQALLNLRVTEPLSQISALFALQRRKFVLIESVERLLEGPQRDAFSTLLSRFAEDPTWRVILTCRQHVAAMTHDLFLTPVGIHAVEIAVPLLDITDVEQVIHRFPRLRNVTSNSRTRELLRNPYYLDKACSIDWTKESTTEALDQRRLRDILWRQVVVREDVQTNGIHLQRERCFREVAVRRARSLQSFVPVAAGEEMAVQTLVADELLIEEPHHSRVAPAHDVLEDWALVRWVSEEFEMHRRNPRQFFDSLGHELAIRRSYRLWLQETLSVGNLNALKAFVEAVLAVPDVESYWKDETLLSILSSADVVSFLAEYEQVLLTNNAAQLRRFIHMLRVACKKPNPFWKLPEEVLGKVFGDMHLVPDGDGWAAVIRLIHRNLSCFSTQDLPLFLGLLEDWKSGVNWQRPLPDAAREVGLIALHFWNSIEDEYHWKDILERLASVLVAIPQAIPTEFEQLLSSNSETESARRDYRNEIIQKKLLASLECWTACRSHPQALASFAAKTWKIETSLPRKSPREMSYAHDMDGHFGLRTGLRMEYYPASALQGPFLGLLQSHPDVGIELILKLNNVATERFVENGLDSKYGDGPAELELDLGGGTTCKQWANPRLWLIYCEGMPAPEILASALMALEKWLLDLGQSGQDLRDLTRSLILKSNSVSITSVVASVAMAHPDKVGDTALVLLRAPEFFELDLQRYVHDQRSISEVFGDSGLDSMQKVHHKDRLDSDKLTHRKLNLEFLACHLQTTPLRDQVWEIIDGLKSALPPLEEQQEEHKLWRLRLHRIDLRNFSQRETMPDGQIRLSAGPPDPDITEVVQKSAPALKANEEATSLVVWGMSAFERREPDKFDPKRWREMLEKARRLAREHEGKDFAQILPHEGGPGYVAAVCVRDHWNELAADEKIWCREFLLAKVTAEKDTENEMLRVQRFSMSSVVAAAQVLPLLLADTDESSRQRVRDGIADAITHSVEQVRQYVAMAVGWYLWERDPNLASACIGGLLDFAAIERCCYGRWQHLPYESRGNLHDLVSKELPKIRARVASAQPLKDRRHYRFSVTEAFSARSVPLIASIIAQQHASSLAQKLHHQIAESFVHSWKHDFRHGGHRRRADYGQRRNYEAETALRRQYAQFVVHCQGDVAVKLWKPFEDAIPSYADEIEEVFKQLIYAEDTAQKGAAFWAIWNATKLRLVTRPRFHERIKDDQSGYAKLASVLLLDYIYWKEDAREWKPLRGHEKEVRDFFNLTGTAPPICRSFIRLLDGVGAFLLPDALNWLAEQVRKGDPSCMIGDRNSLFSLARILTPLVFSQTETLRKNPALRDAALLILDVMVEQGSSAAFRMRDFLITPVAPTA